MSKKWQIPVTWEMCGVVTIEADTLEEAIDRANNDDSIKLPAGSYVDSSFEVSFDDIDCIRELYNNKEPDDIRRLGYGETVQYAVENIKTKRDFFIDFTEFDRPARIHIYSNNIAGTDWYNAAVEISNGTEYISDGVFSANDLNEFKHTVGVCWHRLRDVLNSSLSSQIQAASIRAAETHSSGHLPTPIIVPEH